MLDGAVASKEDIDTAMKGGCGFPMGPLELLDLIGLDTGLSVLRALDEDRHDACCTPAPLLERMVTANQLGRKTGQGFYAYPPTRCRAPAVPNPASTTPRAKEDPHARIATRLFRPHPHRQALRSPGDAVGRRPGGPGHRRRPGAGRHRPG